MSYLPPLNALRAFEAAARRGGFAAAAEDLNVTPAAIGQHVRHLESILGVTLFEREGRGVKLTEHGSVGLERISQALSLMGEASAAMRGGAQSQTLALALPADFSSAWLAPRLTHFEQTRQITFSLLTTNLASNLQARAARDAFDLAVSFAPEPPAGFVAERIMDEVYTPVAAPDLAQTIHTVEDFNDKLLIHDMSQEDGQGKTWDDWLSARGAFGVPQDNNIRVGDSLTALQLAQSGAGVALARRSLAGDRFQQNRLQPLFPDGDMSGAPGYYLLHRPGKKLSPAASLFASWLRGQAAGFHDAADEL